MRSGVHFSESLIGKMKLSVCRNVCLKCTYVLICCYPTDIVVRSYFLYGDIGFWTGLKTKLPGGTCGIKFIKTVNY